MKWKTGTASVFALALAVGGLAGCGGDRAAATDDSRAAVDRELDLALSDAPAEPELKDVPQPLPETTRRPPPLAKAPQAQAPEPVQPPAPPKPPVAEPPQPEPEATPPRPVTPEPQPEAAPPSQPEPQPDAEEPPPEPDASNADESAPGEATEPAVATATIPVGTSFRITLTQELSTKWNRPGDPFLATLTNAITDGETVLVPAGASVLGRITEVTQGDGSEGSIQLTLEHLLIGDQSYPLKATVTQPTLKTVKAPSQGGGVGRIAGGALKGAILGKILGGRSKGVLVGAAAGAAMSAASSGKGPGGGIDAILAVGSQVECSVDQPLIIQRVLAAAGTIDESSQ
ncbi:MAG: hypothetical protein ACE5HQ_03955 [Gemmatimonadota bacterium]